ELVFAAFSRLDASCRAWSRQPMATVPANSTSVDPAVLDTVGPVANSASPEAKAMEMGGETTDAKSDARPKRRKRMSARFDGFGHGLKRVLRQTPSWLTSLIVHTIALVVLGLWYIEPTKTSTELAIVANTQNVEESLVESEKIQPEELATFDSSL